MTAANFDLDPRLAADTHVLFDLPLNRVLLMDDARWPWLVLVPRRAGLTELVELNPDERRLWWTELDHCAAWVRAQAGVRKLNVAALGNVVAQLHVHLIGRCPDADPVWPRPVWGTPGALPYDSAACDAIRRSLRPA